MPDYYYGSGHRHRESSCDQGIHDFLVFAMVVVLPLWMLVTLLKKLSHIFGPKRPVFSRREKEALERAAFVKQELNDAQKKVGPRKPDYTIGFTENSNK